MERKLLRKVGHGKLNKQIKQLDQVKDYTNLNIATGRESLFVDIDLDCPEANILCDYFYQRPIVSLVERVHLELIDYIKLSI